MNSSRLVRAACLVIGIGLAAAAAFSTATAAVPSSAAAPTAVVIRGATADPADPSGGSNDQSGVTVLRGSPEIQPPAMPYACPAGYAYEPGYGCVPPDEPYPASAPSDDYGYWPYYYGYWPYDYFGYWPYFGFAEGRHRAFRPGFAAVRRPAFRPGFAHSPRVGLAPGFAHSTVDFAHGFGGVGGFGHR